MNVNEREGADITAADMVNPPTEPSNIQQYFAGSTVLITGGTGFLGRLLVEKLLRTCPDLTKVYIMVRPKKGKTCEQRFDEYFDDPFYDRLKREQFQSMQKLVLIPGDCALPDLGIAEQDKETIINEVKCIFHSAATVRFDEKLRTAVHINVRGTKDILALAKKVKDLKSIVYISTAYSFCPRREINEVFYEPMITGEDLTSLVKTLKDDTLEKIVPILIGEWPNTYAFTKSVAEDVIKKESFGLPIAIVTPSIVAGTSKDPVAGWIDNFYGATGMFVGIGLGLIRTLYCETNNLSDLVPADYVINSVLAAAWDIANRKTVNLNDELSEVETEHYKGHKEPDIPIYNYVSSPQKPISWGDCIYLANHHLNSVPSVLQVWHCMLWPHANKYMYLLCHYILHILPAYIVDFLACCIGKKPQMVKSYKKIEKFINVIMYFSSQQWIFRNSNTQALWKKLNTEDQKMYEFNMANFDWDMYFYTLIRGGRVYLVKDPLDTIPQAQAKRFRLKMAHYTLVVVLLIAFSMLLLLFWKAVA